jgi:hypothetical protein
MKSRSRSITGALVAIFALPVFIGLTGCLPSLPVPVGDPEKSRIDPYISGIWMIEDDSLFYVFEPYDKRTWLLSGVEVWKDEDTCGEKFAAAEMEESEGDESEIEPNAYEALIADMLSYGVECFTSEREMAGYKVWRTKLGGEWFMTWEPLSAFDAESGFGAKEWTFFRIDTSVPDQLRLWMTNDKHDAWEILEDTNEEEVTQRAVEKIIRKHADEADFYFEDPMIFYRVLPKHYELFEDFINIDTT